MINLHIRLENGDLYQLARQSPIVAVSFKTLNCPEHGSETMILGVSAKGDVGQVGRVDSKGFHVLGLDPATGEKKETCAPEFYVSTSDDIIDHMLPPDNPEVEITVPSVFQDAFSEAWEKGSKGEAA